MSKITKLYHGSKKVFKKFDYEKIGTGASTSGAGIGFYFSSEIEEAKIYGNIIYEIDFPKNLKKEASNFKRTLQNNVILNLIENIFLNSKGEENYYDNFDDYTYQDFLNKTNQNIKIAIEKAIVSGIIGFSDTDIIAGIINSGSVTNKSMLTELCKANITHTKDYWEDNEYPHSEHFILYFEPKIKKIIKL